MSSSLCPVYLSDTPTLQCHCEGPGLSSHWLIIYLFSTKDWNPFSLVLTGITDWYNITITPHSHLTRTWPRSFLRRSLSWMTTVEPARWDKSWKMKIINSPQHRPSYVTVILFKISIVAVAYLQTCRHKGGGDGVVRANTNKKSKQEIFCSDRIQFVTTLNIFFSWPCLT